VEIPALVFFGGVGVVAILLVIFRSQRRAVQGVEKFTDARAAWVKLRPRIARHLEVPEYRTIDDGGKRLDAFGGPVGRIQAEQRPMRVRALAGMLPDADLHAVSLLIDEHYRVTSRGMAVEAELATVVRSRVRTAEERRIMTRAFRRWVLGWPEERIAHLLVDPKVSASRRATAQAAVAAGIRLVDERNQLGELTERFVESLEAADEAYREARSLLRG
jgi:hypothetical protein